MIDTYAKLQTEIQGWLIKTGLDESVRTFITLAEGILKTDPRVRTTKVNTNFSLTANSNKVTMPTDYKAVVGWSTNGGDSVILMPATPATFPAGSTTDGTPEQFIVTRDHGASTDPVIAMLHPKPTTALSTTLIYRAAFTPLSSSNTSNWLLKLSPAVYLYAALMQSAPYLRDDPRLPMWNAQLEDALNRVAAFESGSEDLEVSNVIKIATRPVFGTSGA